MSDEAVKCPTDGNERKHEKIVLSTLNITSISMIYKFSGIHKIQLTFKVKMAHVLVKIILLPYITTSIRSTFLGLSSEYISWSLSLFSPTASILINQINANMKNIIKFTSHSDKILELKNRKKLKNSEDNQKKESH